jgi:hypothetical protein
MRPLNLYICVSMFILMVLLSACEDSSPLPTPAVSISTLDPSTQVTPDVTPDQVSFLSKLQNLSFGQGNKEGRGVFADLQTVDIPIEPFQVVYHLEDVSVSATFSGLSQMERQSLIDNTRIEGNVDWKVETDPNNFDVIMIRINNPNVSFVVYLGELPPITFLRKEPLSYTYTALSGQSTPHLLLWAGDYSTRLLIPEEESSVILTFSEEMRKELPVTNEGEPIESNWIDNTHLEIPLNNMYLVAPGVKELFLRMDTLKALSGNFLGWSKGSLQIRQLPKYEWRDVRLGNPVGSSSRDRFYDQLIFSENKQSYIGVVRLGGSMGDGDGTSFSFVLERKGMDPVVIEDVFYSTIEPGGLPIQWIDKKTLMYSSYFGVYAYDIEKAEKRTLHDNGPNERNNINYAIYDTTRKLLHILAYEDASKESSQLNLLTYGQGNQIPKKIKDFTSSVSVAKYSDLDMNIIPTPEGTYWTRIQEGIPVTEFVDNAGEQFNTKGVVRLVWNQGAYLQQYIKGEFQLESPSWVFWKPGKKAKPIGKMLEYNDMFICGPDLIYVLDSVYYKYDPSLDKWVTWEATNGEKNAEPIKGSNGLYRVQVASASK